MVLYPFLQRFCLTAQFLPACLYLASEEAFLRICYKGETPDETTDAFRLYSGELSEMERRMKHLLDEIRRDNPQEPMQ